MSSSLADLEPLVALPRPGAPAPVDPRHLHAVRAGEQTRPRRKPRLVYGLVAVIGALAIAGTQMGMSIMTTETSYQIKSLTAEQRSVTWQKQMLQDDVAGLSSPQYLAANASALGMVTGQSPSYLRLSDGEITGSTAKGSSTSSVQALKKAAVGNELVNGVPLVTDAKASLGAGAAAETTVVVDPASPPAVADALPTPDTH